MSETNLNKKLEAILEKRRNSQELTADEEVFVTETLDKMLSAKKCVRKVVSTMTGDQIRKGEATPELAKPASTKPTFEDGNPKNRGFEGGYDSKADVDERESVTPDSKQPDAPTRDNSEYTSDKKEEKLPKEDNSGEVKATYQEEEYSNTDEKENDSQYEEDRVGRYLQDRDIVVKPVKKGIIAVGQVLKVYPTRQNDQQAALVKWSNGTTSHENVNDLRLYVEKSAGEKSKSAKVEEDTKASPPVTKADDRKPAEAFLTNCASALSEEDPSMSDEDKAAVCTELWRQIMEGEISDEEAQEATKVAKGELPTRAWLDNCKTTLASQVSKSYNLDALSMAIWDKFSKNSDVTKSEEDTTVRISPEDMDKYCAPCAKKMRDSRVKFLKVTFNGLGK